ncbi:Delta(1)-pyrroline-2-carboxylate reductase [bioreactor metagenome]|uniref:Delta(1)-pyrroline-2-carboxylate reductase n=1 Tax=bioreactor metagenome TaxID=1076179 RepID=A0A644ZTB9_9ZZZZ
MLYLTKQDMINVFSMADAFEAVSKAFAMYTSGEAEVPLRTGIHTRKVEGDALFMPAMAGDALGVKIVSVFLSNLKIGKPATPATMVVMDASTGEVVCLMDGTYLTQIRTAAGAGLSMKLLANKGAKTGALIGLGGQAHCQLLAMLEGAPTLTEVRVFDVDPARREAFAKEHEGLVKISPASSADEAVTDADIITTVTTAKKPVFKAQSVKRGAHVCGIGSYTPEMQEMPEELVTGCDLLVFDTVDGVMSEAGDILTPLGKGLFAGRELNIEMGHVVLGKYRRQSKDWITVYKAVGSGVMDVVAAAAIYERAKAAGVGQFIG